MDEGIKSLPIVKYQTLRQPGLRTFVRNRNWMMQEKIDGVRVTIIKDGSGVKGYNKRREHISIPIWLENVFSVLPGETWIIDGELCKSTFYCFELFAAPDGRAETKSYADRTVMLTALVYSMNTFRVRIPAVAIGAEDKVRLLIRLKLGGAEGAVFRRGADAPRTTHYLLKYKFVSTVDSMVLRKRVDGKAAIEIGLLKEGEYVSIGKCKVSHTIQDSMDSPQVVEVRYRKLSKNGRLIEPVFVRKRSDKKFYECTYNQLLDRGHQPATEPAAGWMKSLLRMVITEEDK